jgi:hypothetical protein
MEFNDSNLNEEEFGDDFNDEGHHKENSKPQAIAKDKSQPANKKKDQTPATTTNGDGSALEKYLATLSEKDRKKYLNLMEKNKQLREELKTISESTEQVLQKEKEKKKKSKLQDANEEKDPTINEKRRVLYDQQAKIQQLKNDIKKKKAELETTYHSDVIREKQDELNDLRRIYEELSVEKDTLERIRKEQERVLKEKEADVNENLRKDELVDKLREAKSTYKTLLDQKNEKEREVNALHGQVVAEKLALRELQGKINDLKNKKKSDGANHVTEADIENLNQQIKELKSKKQNIIEEAEAKMKMLEKSKKEMAKEIETLELTLKEKDKEMRLNSIKLKDLKRLQRHNVLKPIDRNEDGANDNEDEQKHRNSQGTKEDSAIQEGGRKSEAKPNHPEKLNKENLKEENTTGKNETEPVAKK